MPTLSLEIDELHVVRRDSLILKGGLFEDVESVRSVVFFMHFFSRKCFSTKFHVRFQTNSLRTSCHAFFLRFPMYSSIHTITFCFSFFHLFLHLTLPLSFSVSLSLSHSLSFFLAFRRISWDYMPDANFNSLWWTYFRSIVRIHCELNNVTELKMTYLW